MKKAKVLTSVVLIALLSGCVSYDPYGHAYIDVGKTTELVAGVAAYKAASHPYKLLAGVVAAQTVHGLQGHRSHFEHRGNRYQNRNCTVTYQQHERWDPRTYQWVVSRGRKGQDCSWQANRNMPTFQLLQ